MNRMSVRLHDTVTLDVIRVSKGNKWICCQETVGDAGAIFGSLAVLETIDQR